jgi:RNA polymerase sigma-70 factor, ECF subfamily
LNIEDLSLITLVVAKNDHRAFGKLVAKYQSDVRGLLLRLTNGDRMLADDLAQEAFIRAYKYLSSFEGKANFSTWIYRIAYNVYLDHIKTLRRTEDIEGIENKPLPDPPLEKRGGERRMESVELKMDITNALKVLKENEKVCIVMHYERGFSHREISKILKVPLGTVKTNILRGKDKLKRYFNYEQN